MGFSACGGGVYCEFLTTEGEEGTAMVLANLRVDAGATDDYDRENMQLDASTEDGVGDGGGQQSVSEAGHSGPVL